ncbi:MAG: ATP-binding protein, partial [Pseudomonadota bacterium]|nr:ATP-binding protein [Pseudomonadota bacterium]
GTLSLSTADSVNRDGEDYVAITISDTGPGIPPYVMSHLFEPGNSSKGNGHAGLGLAIAKNIVKELRGFITCRNTQRGVSFEILLPKKPSGSIA